jgi:O-acetyl-ADP-ribose deacetylase (regulator of RNase III)
MSYKLINKDISTMDVDIIVNASNGEGYMGGILGKYFQLQGVAESIHYATKGAIEKEAKEKAKKNKYLPSWMYGHSAGEIFITNAGNLSANHIIHAVTMRYPGSVARITSVEKLLPKILQAAYELKAQSLAIPLLGTGIGRIEKKTIYNLYDVYFEKIEDIQIFVVDL